MAVILLAVLTLTVIPAECKAWYLPTLPEYTYVWPGWGSAVEPAAPEPLRPTEEEVSEENSESTWSQYFSLSSMDGWLPLSTTNQEPHLDNAESSTPSSAGSDWSSLLYPKNWFGNRSSSSGTAQESAVVDSVHLPRNDSTCEADTFLCPNLRDKFQASVCCSTPWLESGAYIGLGSECWIDLGDMEEQCDVLDCYKDVHTDNTGKWNTDGCTYVPDLFLNYEACVIHDLCYITPGVTKEECDRVMEENINKIYCNNVRTRERKICRLKALTAWAARKALSMTDSYFIQSEEIRQVCVPKDGLVIRAWKMTLRKFAGTV